MLSVRRKDNTASYRAPWLMVIAGGLSLFIAMGVGRFAYTPILPVMQAREHFSNAVAGYLASSNYLGYLIGAFAAGSIAWIREYRLSAYRFTLTLSVLTTGAMAATPHIGYWLILRGVSGIVSGLVFVLVSSIVLDALFKNNGTKFSGIFYGGVGLGIASSGFIVPVLSKSFGWQGAWFGLMILTMAIAVVAIMWIRDTSRDVTQPTGILRSQLNESRGYFSWLTLAYGFEGLGYIITGTFLVAMANKIPTLQGFASYCWVLVGLAAIPSCVVWPYVANRWGYVVALVTAYFLQAIGVLMTAIFPTAVSVYIGSILFGGTFMGITMLGTMMGRNLRPQNSSHAIGLMTGTYGVGQIIGAGGAGLLASSSGGFELPSLVASGILFVGAILLIVGRIISTPKQVGISRGITG